MSILSELRNRRLGLIELLSMGFDVYLQNLQPILKMFLILLFPFQVFSISWLYLYQGKVLTGGIVWILYLALVCVQIILATIFSVWLALFMEHRIYGQRRQQKEIGRIILSRLIPLILLSLRFWMNVTLRFLILLILAGIVIGIVIGGLSAIFEQNVNMFLLIAITYIISIMLTSIYFVKSGYYDLAFILRDQRGRTAFRYSQNVVKGNWWRVFFFIFLTVFLVYGLSILFKWLLGNISFLHPFWLSILLSLLLGIISIGPRISEILLFFNLEYLKNLKA
jgi:hypothetical protein